MKALFNCALCTIKWGKRYPIANILTIMLPTPKTHAIVRINQDTKARTGSWKTILLLVFHAWKAWKTRFVLTSINVRHPEPAVFAYNLEPVDTLSQRREGGQPIIWPATGLQHPADRSHYEGYSPFSWILRHLTGGNLWNSVEYWSAHSFYHFR